MSIYEALTVLGLKPSATLSDIRAAYRDLVKVWHPDRFGDDVQLRRKAEMRLQEINLAYQVLQEFEPEPRPAIKIEVVQQHSRLYPYHPKPDPVPVESKAKAYEFVSEIKKTKSIRLWAVGLLTVLIIVSLRFGCDTHPDEEASVPVVTATPVATPTVTTEPVVDTIPDTLAAPKEEALSSDSSSSAMGAASPVVAPSNATAVKVADVPAKAAAANLAPAMNTSEAPSTVAAPVSELPGFAGVSSVDQASIEAACTPQKVMRGHDPYLRCVKKQLADLSHAPAAPDLSALDYADREGIESSCASESSLKGPTVYRICVIKKYDQKPRAIHLP